MIDEKIIKIVNRYKSLSEKISRYTDEDYKEFGDLEYEFEKWEESALRLMIHIER